MLRPFLFFMAAIVTAVVLAAGMASITVYMRGDTSPPPEREPVPVLYDLPAFELTNQAGQAVGLDDLQGKVWIANFIFTRCPSICPMVTGRMADIQRTLEQEDRLDDVRLVSFSVDPQHDTPEVLREYGERFNARFERWQFLTGDHNRIWRLIEDGFLLHVAEAPEDPAMPIMHSDKFVLIDRDGRIRGYYSLTDEQANDGWQLFVDLHAVINEPWPGEGDAAPPAADAEAAHR
ncbi:MAG: SCO family protein [Phycisphaeraceae bacterium]